MLMLLPVLLLAFLMRGIPVYTYAYPTGPDYGLHLFYSELFLRAGSIPATVPYWQLGGITWPLLPGGPLIYAVLSGLSGTSVFDLARITPVFGPIEVLGVFFLALRLFKRSNVALFAALVSAVLPLHIDMMSWAGYMNLIGLALMPYALLLWLDYWHQPTWQRTIMTAIVIVGLAYVHHVTTMWLGLTLVIFTAVQIVLQPKAALRKILPIGIVGLAIGLPVLVSVVQLFTQQSLGSVLTQTQRFDTTQVTWEAWGRIMTPVSLVLLIGGMVALIRLRQIQPVDRLLILSYAFVSLLFTFGWVVGLKFQYTRAIYFFSLPMAIGAAALLYLWSQNVARAIAAAALVGSLAVSGVVNGIKVSTYFELVTPDLIEAVNWLKDFSQPDDVVLTGTLYGFQMPRLLDRPLLIAMPPDVISNGDGLAAAADGMAVMKGLYNMDEVLARYQVRFVVVRNFAPELPDPMRSHAVMDADPDMRLVFQNRDVSIYAVEPLE